MQSELKELIQKATQSFLGQAIGQILYCIMVILFGRLLGAEIYGGYIYVYTFLSILTIFAKLGMEHTIIYYTSRSELRAEIKNGVVRFAFLTTIILGVSLCIGGVVFHNWIATHLLNSIEYVNLLIMLLPTIILDAVADLLYSTLRGRKRILEMTIAQNMIGAIIRIVLLLLMCLCLKLADYSCIVIPQYIGSVAGILYCLKKLKSEKWFDKADYKMPMNQYIEVLKYSLPLVLMNGVVLINHNADKYMIGYMMGDAYVAIYTVAVYVGNFSSFALAAINSIFAPMISELYGQGKIRELDELYKKTTRWGTIINLAIFSMTINYPNEIMKLAGGEFETGADILIVIMLGQIINSGVGAVGYLNSMTGHTKTNLFTSIVSVIVNLALNAMLIRTYGMMGAAIASAVSIALSNLLNLWFANRNVHVFPYTKRYLGVGAAFVVSTVLIRIFLANIEMYYITKLLIGGSCFVVIYFITCYLWALESDEKKWIANILGLLVGGTKDNEKKDN